MNTLFQTVRRGSFMPVMLAFTAIVLITGCTQDFNVTDPNSPTPETATLQPLMTGTLANWRYLESNEFIGIMGREIYTNATDDPRILNQPMSGTIDYGAFVCTRPWNSMYYTVANARNLVEFAQKLPAAEKAGVEGVAKTIMAYELLRLSNLWYENGIKIEFRLTRDAPVIKRADNLKEVVRYLDEANTALKSAGASFSFKLGAGFAGYDTPANFAKVNRALRARVAAYQGDYAACLTALGESFISAGSTPADMAKGINHVYSTAPGDRAPSARSGEGGNPYFQNVSATAVRWWAHSLYVSDNTDNTVDTRVTQKVVKPTGVGVPFTISGAFRSSHVVNLYPAQTTPTSIIRNEELLLLRAEANIMSTSPNLKSATDDINLVRKAAGAPDIAALANKDEGLTRLLYERRYSLFFEGFRWVDLKRFNRLDELKTERTTDKVSTVGWPIPLNEIPVN